MLYFKFIVGLTFYELFKFYLPLLQIMVMATRQNRIKLELALKILRQKWIWTTTDNNYYAKTIIIIIVVFNLSE